MNRADENTVTTSRNPQKSGFRYSGDTGREEPRGLCPTDRAGSKDPGRNGDSESQNSPWQAKRIPLSDTAAGKPDPVSQPVTGPNATGRDDETRRRKAESG